MSRRVTWLLVIAVAVATVALLVYSRQTGQEKSQVVAQSPAQQQPVPKATKPVVKDPAPVKFVCKLGPAQAPDIGGARLRMSVNEILSLFPGSKEDADIRAELARPPSQFGSTNFVITPEKYASRERFAGVKQVVFTFMDGRASSINAGYNGPEWKHVDEFVSKFSAGSNLPAADVWEPYVGMDTQMKSLKCDGFEVTVFAGGKGGNANYVQLKDLVADQEVKNRRAKAREKAIKEAKP